MMIPVVGSYDTSIVHILLIIGSSANHRELYDVVEKTIARTIPLWNKTLGGIFLRKARIEYSQVEYSSSESEPTPCEEEGETYRSQAYMNRLEEWEDSRRIKLPEPGEFAFPGSNPADDLDLRKLFRGKGLQVIVKLVNIELTPAKPDYQGVSWHMEGQLVSVCLFVHFASSWY